MRLVALLLAFQAFSSVSAYNLPDEAYLLQIFLSKISTLNETLFVLPTDNEIEFVARDSDLWVCGPAKLT
jgi:hypothetical protein